MELAVIILAAGFGSRMKTDLPKVFHKVAGKTLLDHVVNSAKEINPSQIVVVINKTLDRELLPKGVDFALQKEQKGTADAVKSAMNVVQKVDKVLILNADVPLITSRTLNSFIRKSKDNALGIITSKVKNPHGLGRIIRQGEQVLEIVEQKDVDEIQNKISEIYSGIMLASYDLLKNAIYDVSCENAAKEYYLTSIVKDCVNVNEDVASFLVNEIEIKGVNTQRQLMEVEREKQRQKAYQLLDAGVCIKDAERLDIRGNLNVGRNVTIDVNVVFEGDVTIGDDVTIGPNNYIKSSVIGSNVKINPNNVIEEAIISDDCLIGPFARLRPGADLKRKVRIGNFVEVKNSNVGTGTKISHLSYIGDSVLGEKVNIGAGVITCNYDGQKKHQTKIGDNAFVGSGCQLIAPVSIGEKATIGAGAVIVKDAPAGELTFSVNQQKTVAGWVRVEEK